MNNFEKLVFHCKKVLFQHCFGLCSRLNIPYSGLRNWYYHFIMRQLLPVLDMTYEDLQHINIRKENVLFNGKRLVWVMWWQGINQAPQLVKNNIKNMQNVFGDRLQIITKDNISDYVEINSSLYAKFEQHRIGPALWSDIVRSNLLKNHGGLWIDSTVLLSKRILTLPKIFEGSFISICSKSNGKFNISSENWASWFIGGEPYNPLFIFMSTFFVNYFKIFDFQLDYFLIDYLIYYYVNKDSKLREEIEKQKRDWHALYFYDNIYRTIKSVDVNIFESNINYSVQKLTYRIDKSRLTSDSLGFFILNKYFGDI